MSRISGMEETFLGILLNPRPTGLIIQATLDQEMAALITGVYKNLETGKEFKRKCTGGPVGIHVLQLSHLAI